MTPLLAPLPVGDGPKRAHIRMRRGLAGIARRVAMRALMEGREDVMLEVYAAGISHAYEILAGSEGEAEAPGRTPNKEDR